jgi:putative ABC transport system substrate-binding protein
MSRRRFGRIALGLFIALPRIAIAQSTKVVRRIGVLEAGAPDTPEDIRMAGQPLRELGWVEGKNLLIERRYANGRSEALQPLAEELVRAKVELIVTGGTPATLAAKRATTNIPIVFRAAGDPVLLGIVTNLARPGGNITGFSLSGPEVSAKGLTILKGLLPGIRRIGVLEISSNPYFRSAREPFQHASRSLGLEPIFVEISAAGEIDSAMASLARQRAQAVILRGDSFVYDHRLEITGAALKHGLPTMADNPPFRGRAVLSCLTRGPRQRKISEPPASSTGSSVARSRVTYRWNSLPGSSW